MASRIENKPTFCRICEPLCGMIATVEDGRLVALRPDKDHPLSSGFACQNGIAFARFTTTTTASLSRCAAARMASNRSAGTRR